MRLLLEDDPVEAARIAAELDRLNRERQAIEQRCWREAEAEAMAALGLEEKGAVVVTAAAGWHPGVVGLVAARLKERFGRPAFAIALRPARHRHRLRPLDRRRRSRPGGARAVADGLLIKGGGHAMAAGVTLQQDGARGFRAYLEETLGEAVAAARRDDALLIDAALVGRRPPTRRLMATIARAGPFGAGNAEPVVALPHHTIAYAEAVGQAHVRVRLQRGDGGFVNAIAFRAAGQKLGNALMESRGRAVHAAGCLRSTAGRARSACNCASWTWRPLDGFSP